jgi:F420-0:gamma-glutamyl ligase
MDKHYEIVPVPTRILTVHDNIADAIVEFGGDKIGPKDVVCVAESVVAITQNRAIRPESLKPCFWAKVLSQLFPAKGSIASWNAMQSLMNEEGEYRVLFAVVCGFFAKMAGKPGVFYRMAGEQARLIDDVTGTMPPYDKHIVLGPKNATIVAESIKARCGSFGAAVADVNDLKRSCVLGATEGVDPRLVEQILIDNPFGNASQKTPICVIKNYKE